MEMRWYTVYTKPNCERKVVASLTRKNIENYCPVLFKKNTGKINGCQDFACYVFVKAAECQITELKRINGIKNFLFWINEPVTLKEYEINLIQRFLEEHSHIKLEKKEVGFTTELNNEAPQKENLAKLVYLNSKRIKVALPSLGFMMAADIPKPVIRISAKENKLESFKPDFNYQIAK